MTSAKSHTFGFLRICWGPLFCVGRAIFGPNHPWTKDSARVTPDALGRTEEAAALREKYGPQAKSH
jgi:hypothetical protein